MLSKQSQAFLHRLLLDSNYDCREEVESCAQAAVDRGASLSDVNETICELIRDCMVRNVRGDVIQHAVESELGELPRG